MSDTKLQTGSAPANAPGEIIWPADFASTGNSDFFYGKLKSGLPIRVEVGLALGVGYGPVHRA